MEARISYAKKTVLVPTVGSLVAMSLWSATSAATRQPEAMVIAVERVLPDMTGPIRIRSRAQGLFVLSRRDNAVMVFDKNLTLLKRIGRTGKAPGELDRPVDFDVASDGTVWVADRGNNRLSSFDGDGTHLRSFMADAPIGVLVLRDGHWAVVEAFSKFILRIHHADGTVVGEVENLIPVPGATERQVHYFNRSSLAELPDGEIVAASTFLIPPAVRTCAVTAE